MSKSSAVFFISGVFQKNSGARFQAGELEELVRDLVAFAERRGLSFAGSAVGRDPENPASGEHRPAGW